MKLKKGDTILIITGKDKGKEGKIIKVFPKKERVMIEGLNLYYKHTRPKRQGEKGEKVQVPRPIHISNVSLICSACKKASRVGFRQIGNIKERYCKKCKSAT